MSRGRRHHPLWSRRRVPVTPQESAVANANESLILTLVMTLLALKPSSKLAMTPSQPSEADG